jgi:hypothetical protein
MMPVCPTCHRAGRTWVRATKIHQMWDDAARTSTGMIMGAQRIEFECPDGHVWMATPAPQHSATDPVTVTIQADVSELRDELARIQEMMAVTTVPVVVAALEPEAWLEEEIARPKS